MVFPPTPKPPSLLVGITHPGEMACFILNENKVRSLPSWVSNLAFRKGQIEKMGSVILFTGRYIELVFAFLKKRA